jgi:hypothetical protein
VRPKTDTDGNSNCGTVSGNDDRVLAVGGGGGGAVNAGIFGSVVGQVTEAWGGNRKNKKPDSGESGLAVVERAFQPFSADVRQTIVAKPTHASVRV